MQRRHLWLGFLCLLLISGCTENQTPTLDLPTREDADLTSVDATAPGEDAQVTFDMGPIADQAFIPSSSPIPTRVETALGTDSIAAGSAVMVTCTVYDQMGVEMSDISTRLDLRPLDGISAEGSLGTWTIEPERIGTYQLYCTVPSAGLRDLDGATLSVTPGPIAWTQAFVTPELIVAGQTAAVRCEQTDIFGNEVDDPEASTILYSPLTTAHSLEGRTFTTTLAGEVSFQCNATNATTTAAVLVVRPEAPNQLTANAIPQRMNYGIGEVVSISHLVSDRYGNPLLGYPVDIAAPPALQPFGPARYRLEAEGFHTINISVSNTEPPLAVDLSIRVDDRGPTLDCDAPAFGESILLPSSGNITLAGFAQDLSGVQEVLIDGTPVPLTDEGRFNVEVVAQPGVNFYDLEAIDTLGQSTRALCSLFAASAYVEADQLQSDTIRLDLRQGAVDDGDNGNEVRSFGDLARSAVRSDALRVVIDDTLSANPRLLRQQDFSVGKVNWIDYRGNLSIDDVNLALALQENALGVGMSLARVKFDARVKGKIYVPIFPDIQCEFDGDLRVNNVTAVGSFTPQMVGGTVTLQSNGTQVNVGNVGTDFDGVCGNLVDTVLSAVGAFSSLLEDTVADALASLIDESLAGLLSSALTGLDFSAFAFNFELDGFGGEPTNLTLQTELTSASANNQRLRLGLGTKVDGPLRNALPTAGLPIFGEAVSEQYPSNGTMSALLNADLLNQVMYGLWRANFFNIGDVAELSGSSSNLEASITLLVPPAVDISPDGEHFILHFGPAVGTLSYAELFEDPVELRFGARLRAGISLVDGEVTFAPDGLTFDAIRLDVANSGLPADLAAALESEIAQIVSSLLDDAVSGAFPTLPVPSFALPPSVADFGLPAGLSLGIQNTTLQMDGETIIINGDLAP